MNSVHILKWQIKRQNTRIPRRAVSHLPPGGVGGGGGGWGAAQVQHQLQQWAKYGYSIVWDVLTQSIHKG